jgi:hypothetical protein
LRVGGSAGMRRASFLLPAFGGSDVGCVLRAAGISALAITVALSSFVVALASWASLAASGTCFSHINCMVCATNNSSTGVKTQSNLLNADEFQQFQLLRTNGLWNAVYIFCSSSLFLSAETTHAEN